MKKHPFQLTALFTGLMILISCSQAEEKGQLTFGLDLVEETLQKAAASETYLTTALVSIISEEGTLVYDKEPVELIRFGDGLITRSLRLPVGGFTLTEFMLTDASGEVLWATPMEGSRLAGLVQNPLPQYFKIHPNESTSVNIQVIRVGNHPPEDFGYAQFNIDFVERFCLKVHYTQECPWYGFDSIMGPNGDMIPYYQSRLMVYLNDQQVLEEPLYPGINHVQLPLIAGRYLVMATGCDGNNIFKEYFSLDELSGFRCDPNDPPLMIPAGQDPDIVITPEGIYEPTIRQGLFGQLIGPLDSFMDSTLNLDQLLVRDIYLFPYHVLDSIYTLSPINCYISPELLPERPVAKVRTNSEGYFQLELEPGEYLYLVKTDQGYYMDAFVSSHRPGYVMIYPEEVTRLMIGLMDCSMWM